MRITVHGAVLELVEGDITNRKPKPSSMRATTHCWAAAASMERSTALEAGDPGPSAQAGRLRHRRCQDHDGGVSGPRYVIHTVGPIYWQEEPSGQRSCWLPRIAAAWKWRPESGLRSVAFPSISTGAYGYPMRSGTIALRTAMDYWKLNRNLALSESVLCCMGRRPTGMYERALAQLVDVA